MRVDRVVAVSAVCALCLSCEVQGPGASVDFKKRCDGGSCGGDGTSGDTLGRDFRGMILDRSVHTDQHPSDRSALIPDGAGPDGLRPDGSRPDVQPRWDAATPDAVAPDSAALCQLSLAQRVVVTAINVAPDRVQVGHAGGFSANRPIFLSTHASGARAAWSDNSGNIHITSLAANDTRMGADIVVPGESLRGFVAHSDAAAVLVRRGDAMVLERLDNSGAVTFSEAVVGNNDHNVSGAGWIDSWPHEGRLGWSGDQYAAYFGHTGNRGDAGNHQGDYLAYYSAQGQVQSGGWPWGCSHSVDVRLVHNGSRFGAICLSDCYPTKGFRYMGYYREIRGEPSGDCAGGTDAELGGVVAAPGQDGFYMTFTSPQGRASADVGLVYVPHSGNAGQPMWLTDTAGVEESAPQLAKLGDVLLVGYRAGQEFKLMTVDYSGTALEGPTTIAAQFADRDDFTTFANGDAGWAYAWGDMGQLKIVRVAGCE